MRQLLTSFSNSSSPTIAVINGGDPTFDNVLQSFSELLSIPSVSVNLLINTAPQYIYTLQ